MLLGFLAGAVAVLVFQQGSWALLYEAGLMPPPFPTVSVPPYDLPQIANLCFWGGVWGALFGWLPARLRRPWWRSGLALGAATVLIGTLVVPLVKDVPWTTVVADISGRGVLTRLLLNVPFGIGTALLLTLLLRRRA